MKRTDLTILQRFWLETLWLGARVFAVMPYWFKYYVVENLLFVLLYYCLRYRMKVVKTNLRNSFPEKSERELAVIRRRFYRTLSEIFVDTINIPTPEGEDEPQLANESPLDYVQRTAYEKAQHAFSHLTQQQSLAPQQAILCADTTVELNHQVFGKAATEAEAVAMLSQLSGHTQRVHTAVVIVLEGQYHHILSTSLVTFASLSQHEIQTYCRTGDYQGKAGAYGIQGPAAAFVRHLEGSYSGVMGLPLHETYTLLTQLYPQT